MDLLDSEEEDNCVRGHDHHPREEEGEEDGDPWGHVAVSTLVIVIISSSHNNHHYHRKPPPSTMIKLFQIFWISISPYYHLIKIESHTKCPDEVGEEEVVEDHGWGYAHHGVIDVEGEEEEELCKKICIGKDK